MTTTYRSIDLDGLDLFVREAGPPRETAVLLLHGFPSSSRMYEPLLDSLGDEFRLIAPDYPGFGHSSALPPSLFTYTFDNISIYVERLLDVLGVKRYVLFMEDYGGPVGFRLALRNPERVRGLIVQNAVSHEEGLGPVWETRRQFWNNREAMEAKLRANLASFEATRLRHVGTSPHPERYNPDTWVDEFAFLSRPGQLDIQTELFYDYRTNVAAYPQWQEWMRLWQPPALILWGKYDASFTVQGGQVYLRDLPKAGFHLLEAGHFALDEAPDEVCRRTREFLRQLDL